MSESTLRGSLTLTKLVVRRERVRIAVWIAAVVGLMIVSAASVKGLYSNEQALAQAAAVSQDNAAAIAFNGAAQGLDTIGGQVAFNSGAFGMILVGLMSALMIGRLTRGEEEAGRAEVLSSLPIGRHALTTAALVVTGAMNLLIATAVTGSFVALGLPRAGSISFGASFLVIGLLFAGVALVAAQITENTRVVYGMSGAVIGASFVIRAIGDVGDGSLSWLSPIGIAQKARPYAGERWWPFLVLVGLVGAQLIAAGALASHRDHGGSLIRPRPGRVHAAPSLPSPLGLALRLQRGSLIGWAIGVAATAAAYGSVVDSIESFVTDNQALADMLARFGGASLTDAYLATSFRMLALMGSGFAIQSVLRLRSEELSLRADPVLATPVGRSTWATGHLAIAFGGSVAMLLVAGAGTAVTHGVVGGDLSVIGREIWAPLPYAPAMWVLAALAFAVVGRAPRAIAAAWAALSVCLVIGLLGDLLGLPDWVKALSPFEHAPRLPASSMSWWPVLALSAVAAALTTSGLAGLRRRDLG